MSIVHKELGDLFSMFKVKYNHLTYVEYELEYPASSSNIKLYWAVLYVN